MCFAKKNTVISNILEVLAVLLPMLIGVAFVTVAERKTMGSMQRRLGPNSVGQLKVNTFIKRSSLHSNISPLILNNNNTSKKEGIITRKINSSLCTTSIALFSNPNWITGFVDAFPV